jgi:hypothetical protein
LFIVKHRVNTLNELKEVNQNFGVEIDLRSKGDEIILHHEPYRDGELFIDWLQEFKHALLILNVKEEGLEEKIFSIMNTSSIENFFFLDQSFPFLIKYASLGNRKAAIRMSEFESIETLQNMKGKIDWVWVDCFSGIMPDITLLEKVVDLGFKICLVSPELQNYYGGRHLDFIKKLKDFESISAVCTKFPLDWQEGFIKHTNDDIY